jgi:hypothetical protein
MPKRSLNQNGCSLTEKLMKKQDKLRESIPSKYANTVSDIVNAEYYLTLIEEGHEAETYEYEMYDITKKIQPVY